MTPGRSGGLNRPPRLPEPCAIDGPLSAYPVPPDCWGPVAAWISPPAVRRIRRRERSLPLPPHRSEVSPSRPLCRSTLQSVEPPRVTCSREAASLIINAQGTTPLTRALRSGLGWRVLLAPATAPAASENVAAPVGATVSPGLPQPTAV